MQAELQRLRALEQEQADALRRSMIELQEYQKKNSQLEAVLQERLAELERARREAEEAQDAARQQAADLDRLRLASAGSAGAAGALLQKDARGPPAEERQAAGRGGAAEGAARVHAGRPQDGWKDRAREGAQGQPRGPGRARATPGSRGGVEVEELEGRDVLAVRQGLHALHRHPADRGGHRAAGDCSSPKKSARSNHELQE
ncbi:unnamed protein product, partial [Prorocentrum cordatum]